MSCCCCKPGKCRSLVRLDGKTVVITGANTGIGKETARDMVARGAHVVMGCRDIQKAEEAVNDIFKSLEGNSHNGTVVVKNLDLASFDSIRKFAKEVLDTEERIDILINNAGIMMCPHMTTKDGFEMQFGVNHLGHFLLTNLLLRRIKRSAPARIVVVSSLAHKSGEIDFNDINSERKYSPLKAYCQSKLANVLFSEELAHQLAGTEVTTYSLHPGAVNTELMRHIDSSYGAVVGCLGRCFAPCFFKTPEQGAQTSIYCAVAEELKGMTGRYYSDCAEETPSRRAQDREVAKRLWELSVKLVGLTDE